MFVALRTSRFLPALLAATLLLGVTLPLVQHVCAMSAEAAAASPPAASAKKHLVETPESSQIAGHRLHAGHHTDAAECAHDSSCTHPSLGVPCSIGGVACEAEVSEADTRASSKGSQATTSACSVLTTGCYEATRMQGEEAHMPTLRLSALVILPLTCYLSHPRAGTAAVALLSSPEDASPPDVPARLRFAVLLL